MNSEYFHCDEINRIFMVYDSVNLSCRKNTPLASDHECSLTCRDPNSRLNIADLKGLRCYCRSAFNCRWIGISDRPDFRPNNLESVLTCMDPPAKDRCSPPVHQPVHIIDPVKDSYRHKVTLM